MSVAQVVQFSPPEFILSTQVLGRRCFAAGERRPRFRLSFRGDQTFCRCLAPTLTGSYAWHSTTTDGRRTRPSYSIIIPAYNESARIGLTLEKVLAHVADRGWNPEVIAVDDGSSDTTADIVRAYALEESSAAVVQNPGNRGKGYSVRNGMLHGQGEILLFS